jgi:hypothetical protein
MIDLHGRAAQAACRWGSRVERGVRPRCTTQRTAGALGPRLRGALEAPAPGVRDEHHPVGTPTATPRPGTRWRTGVRRPPQARPTCKARASIGQGEPPGRAVLTKATAATRRGLTFELRRPTRWGALGRQPTMSLRPGCRPRAPRLVGSPLERGVRPHCVSRTNVGRERRLQQRSMLCQRWGRAPRSRLAGAGFKPPRAAGVKSPGGERRWKRRGIDCVRCDPKRRTRVNR